MISAKMTDLVKNGSAIRAMFEEGKIMADKYGRENVYDFSLGNPYVNPPVSVKNAVAEILESEDPMILHGYMTNAGYEDVRLTISESTNRKHGTSFAAGNIIMTCGAAGALNVVFKTLLDPGDEVIVFAPFFGEYRNYIENFGGKIVIVPPGENFSINFSALEEKISPATKAVIINSPNNPTGAVYTAAEIQKLADILNAKQKELGIEIYLVSDEPYRQIVYGNAEVPYITKYYANSMVAYSYSKTLSIPGERIGYLNVPSEITGFNELMPALSTANRILGYVNAPSLFQKVAARCADEVCDFSLYESNKNMLYKSLTDFGYECFEPKGAFYLFVKCFIPDDREFCNSAKQFRLLIVPGSTFGCSGYFRLAYCVSGETVRNSLDSFKKLAELYNK